MKKKGKYCDTNTLRLFAKVDKAVWKSRNYNIKSRIYITPDVEAQQFYDTIMTIAPTFYTETNKHKQTLVNMLLFSDNLISVGSRLNFVRILYNLCFEEYIEIIRQVNQNYGSNSNNRLIIEKLLFQDLNLCGTIEKYYYVDELKNVLDELVVSNSTRLEKQGKIKDLERHVKEILSGRIWKELMYNMYEDQYIIKPTRCEKI